MKRQKLLIFLALIGLVMHSQYVLCQKDPIKFGKIDNADLEMKIYDKDTSAEAIVLCDYGNSYFTWVENKDFFVFHFIQTCRIKILKKEGYEFANVTIPLYKSNRTKETISGIKGYTYNLENGKMVELKMKKDAIFEEEVNENYNKVKFTLPNVKEGSIIEYTYEITSDFLWSLREWYFQSSIPVKWSEYRVSIPEYLNYKAITQGFESFSINERSTKPGFISYTYTTNEGGQYVEQRKVHSGRIDYTNNISRWVIEYVPAFKDEPFLPNKNDYINKIKFEIANTDFTKIQGNYKDYTQSWEAITASLLTNDHFGVQLKRHGLVKDEIEKVTANLTETEAKMIAIYNYVKDNMKWNEKSSIYVNETLRKAMNEKQGNSGDINHLLTLMCKDAGLEAHPVILSTIQNGKLNFDYPTVGQMNYVITLVQINDKRYLLDATDKCRPYNVLPPRCFNGRGKIIRESSNEWINLIGTEKSFKQNSLFLKMNPKGELSGKVQSSYGSLEAFEKREEINKEGEDKYKQKFIEKHPTWEISDFKIDNLVILEKNLIETFNINLINHASVAGDMIYLNPIIIERQENNPFKLEKRKFPIDFLYPVEEKYMLNLSIPEGYKVEQKPENINIGLPENGGTFSYTTMVLSNSLQILCQLNIKKTFYLPGEYEGLKEFFNKIVAKQAEQVVLKKI